MLVIWMVRCMNCSRLHIHSKLTYIASSYSLCFSVFASSCPSSISSSFSCSPFSRLHHPCSLLSHPHFISDLLSHACNYSYNIVYITMLENLFVHRAISTLLSQCVCTHAVWVALSLCVLKPFSSTSRGARLTPMSWTMARTQYIHRTHGSRHIQTHARTPPISSRNEL